VLGPVLLVPATAARGPRWSRLAGRIRATGRTATVVALPGNGTGDLAAQVDALDRAVDGALAAGAPSVDVVGYSAGGVVAGLWIARDDGAAKARRVVTLGSPCGAPRWRAAPSRSPRRLPGRPAGSSRRASAEVRELAPPRWARRLPWLSIWTTADQTVTPPDSARLDGAVDVASRTPAAPGRSRTGSCRAIPRPSRWCCAACPSPR
jgi:alpha-beta hydrolase superfamily lysophospholipase